MLQKNAILLPDQCALISPSQLPGEYTTQAAIHQRLQYLGCCNLCNPLSGLLLLGFMYIRYAFHLINILQRAKFPAMCNVNHPTGEKCILK